MILIHHLNLLESTGLIRLLSARPELEYLFRHALVQDAAYSSLLKQDRKKLHLAVGEALEHLYPDQRNEQAATLAYHFERAEVRDKAVHYLVLAGDRARDGYANAEAIAFYQAAINQVEQILSLGTNSAERWRGRLAQLFEGLADVLELIGRHETARLNYDRALISLAHLMQPERHAQARIHRKIGIVHTMSRQHQEARRAWDQAEESLGRLPSGSALTDQAGACWREWIEIQVERAWNYYWRFQTEEMERLCEQIKPVMGQYGTPVQRARVIMVMTLARIQRDRYLPCDETLALGQEALNAAVATGDLNLIFDARFNVGFMHLWRREFALAEVPFLVSMELVERTGDAVRTSRCVTYLMMLARMRGQVAETRGCIPRVLDLACAGQMAPYTYTAKACLAWIAWRKGDLAEARAEARTALDLLQGPLTDYPIKWLAHWPLLAISFAEQNDSVAIEYAHALLHPTQARMPEPLTSALEAALAASEQEQAEETRARLDRAVRLAQEMGYL
jgi:hypothetical protein